MINDRYFPHDYNARHDPKLKAIESLFENAYSYYFKSCEYIYQNKGELEVTRFFLDNLKDEIKAKSKDEVEQFLTECMDAEINLFYYDERKDKKYLRSRSIDKRLQVLKQKSKSASDSAAARWKKGEKKPSQTKTTFDDKSIEVQIAKKVFRLLAEPNGAKPPNWQSWAKQIDLILRVDKRPVEYVEKTIAAIKAHVGSGGFSWSKVIRSPDKLRKQMNAGQVSPSLNNSSRPSQGVQGKGGKYADRTVKK